MMAVRASSLPGWPDCPRRWAARHLAAEITAAGHELRQIPTSVGAPIGTAVHAAAASLLTAKMMFGEVVPADISHARGVAQDSLCDAIHGSEITYDKDGTTRHLRDAEVQVIRMVGVCAAGLVPAITPVAVERRLEARVPGTSLILTGQSDTIEESGGGLLADAASGAVDDLKCGKRLWWSAPQLGAYAFLEGAHGRRIDDAWIHHIPRVKADKDQPPVASIHYEVGACRQVAWNILHDIDRSLTRWHNGDQASGLPMRHPDAFQVNPSSMLCLDRWCPAHSTGFCRHGRT